MNLNSILEFTRHDPLAVLGFVLVGLGGVSAVHVWLKLVRSGYGTPGGAIWTMIVRIPLAYLRTKDCHGWPAWPAYTVWICYGTGIITLVIGLFHLPG
jgi:hypothetical protein